MRNGPCNAPTSYRAPDIRSTKANASRVAFATPSCVAAPFCATTHLSMTPSATAATSGDVCRLELARSTPRHDREDAQGTAAALTDFQRRGDDQCAGRRQAIKIA